MTANTTLTFEIQGEVALREFASGMDRLWRLLHALAHEVSRQSSIEWIVEDLRPGSAVATVRGESAEIESVERVVGAYANVGRALQAHRPIPYSERVRKHAEAMMTILEGRATAIRFETAEEDALIVRRLPSDRPPTITSYGAVEGKIETLSSRRALRFVLYDAVYERAVSCYLSEDQKDSMRNLWDRWVIVEGLITRDAATGRPMTIRHITAMTPLESQVTGGYRSARGIAPIDTDHLLAEDAVRRVRDA